MKRLLCFVLLFLAVAMPVRLCGQPPYQRSPLTTNLMMNPPQDGWIPIWNNVAKKYSNGVNVASSTNLPAYLQTSTLTNLAGTGLSPGATNAGFYIGSNAGKGTNTTLLNNVQLGDATAAGATTVSNDFISKFRIRSDPGATISMQDTAATTANRALYLDIGRNIDTLDTVDGAELGYLDGVTSGIQAQIDSIRGLSNVVYVNAGEDLPAAINALTNNATLIMSPGTFTITASNNVGSLDPIAAPMRLINKTNVTIRGSGFGTKWSASGTGQSFLVLSNCHNVTVEDFTIDGGWSGYTSNGLNGINGSIALAGTNNLVTVRRCNFQNIGGFGVMTGYRPSLIDKCFNLWLLDCSAYNCGLTNMGSITGGQPDGGFFAGGGDSMLISRFHVVDSIRMVEFFTLNSCTNMSISDGVGERNYTGLTTGGKPATSVQIQNIVIKGGNTYPMESLGSYQQGIAFGPPAANISINNCHFTSLKGRAIYISSVGAADSISNVTISSVKVFDGGINSTITGGIAIEDAPGGGVIQGVTIRDCTLVNNAFQAIQVFGGRDITIENNSIVDATRGDEAADAIALYTDGSFDACRDITVRHNLIKSFSAVKPVYGIGIASGVGNARIIDNTITNMGTGLINNSSTSTIIVEPVGYSFTNNHLIIERLSIISGATSNYVWTCTNATTGQGEWRVSGGAGGGGPGTLPMDANQFDTNNPVTVKNGALLTNINIRAGLTLPTLTASRAAIIDASGNVTNVTSGSPSTEFVRADGTAAVPSGSGSTNNVAQGIGTADITNAVKRYWVHLGDTTNLVLNWSVTNYVIASPSNTFTLSFANAPAAGTPAQSLFLELQNTNSTSGFFPTNGFNGSPVIMLSAPSTNTYVFHFDGTNFWTESGQILTTGLGDTNVFNINPVLHNPTSILAFVQGTLTVNSNIHVLGTSNGRLSIQDTNGTTNVVLASTLNGVIGIGTNNPQVKLHVRTVDTNDLAHFDTSAGQVVRIQTNRTVFQYPISAPTNVANFTITTNDFVSGQLYTNVAQRASVTATISLTNVLSTDFARMSLWVDQDADGSFEMQGRNVSVGGVALVAATEVLWARLQPGARFSFTNQSGGTAVASVVANSSDWTKE